MENSITKNKTIILSFVSACLIILIWIILSRDCVQPQKHTGHKLPQTETKFPIMGTFAHISVYAEPEMAQKAIAKVREVFSLFQQKCNIFDPESEIYRLNHSAAEKAFKCSPLIWNMFNSSRRAYALSEGAFDVSACPLMQLWGFYRKRGDKLPTPEEIRTALDKIGMDKIIFDDKNHTVKFKVPGMSIDFGGIAKGIAVQIATEKIKEMGIKHAVIDLGGNMYCLGSPPAPRKFYVIGIRNPLEKGKICHKLALRDQGVATSGNYERDVVINGQHYTHIMNPKTGKPVADMLSVTVVCPSAGDADFLSTTIFIKGAEFAKKLCESNPKMKIVIIQRAPQDKSKPEVIILGSRR